MSCSGKVFREISGPSEIERMTMSKLASVSDPLGTKTLPVSTKLWAAREAAAATCQWAWTWATGGSWSSRGWLQALLSVSCWACQWSVWLGWYGRAAGQRSGRPVAAVTVTYSSSREPHWALRVIDNAWHPSRVNGPRAAFSDLAGWQQPQWYP